LSVITFTSTGFGKKALPRQCEYDVKNLRSQYLQQAGKRNIFTMIQAAWEEP